MPAVCSYSRAYIRATGFTASRLSDRCAGGGLETGNELSMEIRVKDMPRDFDDKKTRYEERVTNFHTSAAVSHNVSRAAEPEAQQKKYTTFAINASSGNRSSVI